MTLGEQLRRQGGWLFRWRGVSPFLCLPLVWLALRGSNHPEPAGWHWIDTGVDFLCLGVSLLGVAIRIATVGFVASGTSGRVTRRPKATRLNTTGLYSVTRNPLYLGNFLILLGICLMPWQAWLVLAYVLLFWLYYERIVYAEEAYLDATFGDEFREWAARTPVFLPDIRRWRRPDLPFSMRMVLRREYGCWFGVVAGFAIVDLADSLLRWGSFHVDGTWMILLGLGATSYLVLRLLHKRTDVLRSRRELPRDAAEGRA